MTPSALSGWRPMLAAFVVWFSHFMGSWVAVEIWPGQWPANWLAWALTALALGLLGLQWARLHPALPDDAQARWNRRVGRGAVAIAAAAVVFSAVPSLVFLP